MNAGIAETSVTLSATAMPRAEARQEECRVNEFLAYIGWQANDSEISQGCEVLIRAMQRSKQGTTMPEEPKGSPERSDIIVQQAQAIQQLRVELDETRQLVEEQKRKS